MSQVDALKMVEHVRGRLVDLAVSENHFRDKELSDSARKVWEGPGAEGGLVSELWVEGAFPGLQTKDSLKSLSEDGLFPADLCNHLNYPNKFPSDRYLYNHQSEVIRKIATNNQHKPAFVITAGTGLGKTEAFLLPMLSDLWTAPARQNNGGMRCLILYPMNALVADQVERIYNWLIGQNRLSVFHFTSETHENYWRANRDDEPIWELCRARTREEARGFETHDGKKIEKEPYGKVPDIVITNYSMLEYMLCRPQDSRFFGPDLRCIIIDEAHLYSGALAAEIMMLLRRLRERCGVSTNEVLHIATSATLGGNDDDLQDFASLLFSTSKMETQVVRGQNAEQNLGDSESSPTKSPSTKRIAEYADLDFQTLTPQDELIEDNENTVHILRELVSLLVSESVLNRSLSIHPKTPARFLHESLREAPLVRRIAEILGKEKGNVISLNDLASRIFNNKSGVDERNAIIALLRLSATARQQASDLPLIPHRLHFLVRAPEGLAACLNPKCSGPTERNIPTIGCLQPLGDHCRYCGHITLPVNRCENCGEWALAVHENQESSTLEPGYYSDRTYYLLTRPKNFDPNELYEVVIDSNSGEIRGHGTAGVSLWKAPFISDKSKDQKCPTCHSSWTIHTDEEQQPEWRRTCQRLVGGRPFALSVTTETVLHDLPPYRGKSRHWKPAEGRRLLAFSDSRASAARLGPLLTQQHEMQVIRAAMVRCTKEMVMGGTANYLADEVNRLVDKIAKPGIDTVLKQHLITELQDKKKKLNQAKTGTIFPDFAALVANREEVRQILDREIAERQKVKSFGQSAWDENYKKIKANIEGLIACEFERPLKKRTTVESVGLIEIVYPGIENLLLPHLLEEKLPKDIRMKIVQIWPEFVTLLLDSVRSDSCVTWGQKTPGRMWLGESPFQERWLTRSHRGWNAIPFVGSTQNQLRRKFTTDVLISAGCNKENLDNLSEETLRIVFDQLFQMAGNTESGFEWLQKDENHETGHEEADKALQILMDKLTVRKPIQIYRCEATGTIWTHSAFGWAPVKGCLGTLHTIDPETLDNDVRWGRARREFSESPIFSIGLWAEEHSAQLSPRENRRLQDLFKDGIRNVLSSTTTMELGIDIGGLNGVLLGNVPPGPANHRQRAGRAGRRSDGSAVVVTYSRESEYDREVFQRFGEFLRRELRKPTVFHERERIIRRHLHAVILSEFLRSMQLSRTGAMHAYGRMGSFCGINNGPTYWKHESDPKPVWSPDGINIGEQFLEFLDQLQTKGDSYQVRLASLAEHTGLSTIMNQEGWLEFINTAINLFHNAIEQWKEDIEQLREAWNEIPIQPRRDKNREMAKANSISHHIKELCDITVIEWLSDRRFLPRYGFPINLQRLTVRKAIEDSHRDYSTPDERYRLERSSLLALAEYVPESRVLVGGRVATSRGLRKHWTDSNLDKALGLQYFSLECPEGHIYIRQSPDEPCPTCAANPNRKQLLVFPRYGYTTAGWDKLPLGTNIERIGKQSVCPTAFAEQNEGKIFENFAEIPNVRIIYREEAPLLVRNNGSNDYGFAICTRCGFAMSEIAVGEGKINLVEDFEKHASIFSSNANSFCWKKSEQIAPILRNRVLAAKELTDMILLEWPGATRFNHDGTFSLGRALVLAGARLLELDERELGIELMPLIDENLGIVIYDAVPGGAGHCFELINLGREWIDVARNILFIDEKHNLRCKKACIDCILNFSGQYSEKRLDRLAALNLIDEAMS